MSSLVGNQRSKPAIFGSIPLFWTHLSRQRPTLFLKISGPLEIVSDTHHPQPCLVPLQPHIPCLCHPIMEFQYPKYLFHDIACARVLSVEFPLGCRQRFVTIRSVSNTLSNLSLSKEFRMLLAFVGVGFRVINTRFIEDDLAKSHLRRHAALGIKIISININMLWTLYWPS